MKNVLHALGARSRRVLAGAGVVLLGLGDMGAYVLQTGAGAARPEQSPEPPLGGPGPAQPIAFLHSVHAGQNQIPCQYCHYVADRSPSAGVPSVQVCAGCHLAGATTLPPDQVQQLTFPVKGGGQQRPDWWYAEAAKILEYWKAQKPIPWVRVHQLPMHARFPHYMHVQAGLQCQTCHGPVEQMDKVYQYASLQMGWCIECHRGESQLSAAEEQAVRERSTFRRRMAALQTAGGDVRGWAERWPNQRASTDCFVCHY